MTPLITCEHVTFGYQPNELILERVSFQAFEKDFIGIIGPNGGGKSTLLKLILGLLTPTAGTITILGRPANCYPNHIGYVPQHLQFDRQFPINVLDVVLQGRLKFHTLFSAPSPNDKAAALAALEQIGLVDLYKQPFGSLSGGQIQRVLIARALASEPKILLLDEPTASVDAQAEASILELLDNLSEKLTILMVTHNLRAIIDHIDMLLCVQGKCTLMHPKEICEHFALGLYHHPLIDTSNQHLIQLPTKKP